MQRFISVACAAALVSSCLRIDPTQSRAPLSVVEVRFDSPTDEPDRIERVPRFVIIADRPLGPPNDDSVWLLTGAGSDALRSAAARGSLGTSDRARRIAVDLALDPDDPSRLVVTPREPVQPDTSLVLVAGYGLRSADGVPLAVSSVASRVVMSEFRVAPARECSPLARLVFPAADSVPRNATLLVVAFDRPVQTRTAVPLRIERDDGVEVPTTVHFECPDDSGAPRCLYASPREPLEARRAHTLRLDGVVDDSDRAPRWIDSHFITSSTLDEPRVLASDPIACTNDETALAPYCVRHDRGALVVRGETLVPAGLRVRFGDLQAQSPVGTSHLVRIERAWSQMSGPLVVAPVALDGVLWSSMQFEGVEPPVHTVRLRIREVFAKPHSGSAQEFVEIENVSDDDVATDGLRVATPTGSAALPSAMIPPRARAIVVGAAFDPRGGDRGSDAATAPGTIVLRLDGTLAGHGLADRGADVWIADADGQPVTRAPTGNPLLAPRLGVSVVRADSRMSEDDPASWTYDAADGSTPGALDRLR